MTTMNIYVFIIGGSKYIKKIVTHMMGKMYRNNGKKSHTPLSTMYGSGVPSAPCIGTRLHSRKWVVGEQALNICIYSCSPITGITVWVPPHVQSVVGLDSHRSVSPTVLESPWNYFHHPPMSVKTLSSTKPTPGAKKSGTAALRLPMQNSYDFSYFLLFPW